MTGAVDDKKSIETASEIVEDLEWLHDFLHQISTADVSDKLKLLEAISLINIFLRKRRSFQNSEPEVFGLLDNLSDALLDRVNGRDPELLRSELGHGTRIGGVDEGRKNARTLLAFQVLVGSSFFEPSLTKLAMSKRAARDFLSKEMSEKSPDPKTLARWEHLIKPQWAALIPMMDRLERGDDIGTIISEGSYQLTDPPNDPIARAHLEVIHELFLRSFQSTEKLERKALALEIIAGEE